MIICVTGPTAVGKTALSIALAHRYNAIIINCDAMQVYKGLDIGTAKVTEEEKESVPHYLLDFVPVDVNYTVFDYQRDTRALIDDIISRGKTPILCGGTGLYVKAALYDYEFKEENNKGDYSKYSNDELYEILLKIDPNTTIHKNNRKRVERAIDCFNQNGFVPSSKKSDKLLYDTLFIGLTTDRDYLYERINYRVDVMVNNGLIEEAKWIYETNIRTKAVMTPIGYKELFPYFEGKSSLEECLDLIKRNSRRYAKRQYTWFNNQMDVKWFDVDFNDFNL